MRLKVHPALCEGHGLCRRWAPGVYVLDDDGHLALRRLAVPAELEAEAELGAAVCPAHAITVLSDGAPEGSARA